MKEILLKIDDGIYAELRTSIAIAKGMGNLATLRDELCVCLVVAIEEGQREMCLIPKTPEKKRKSRKKPPKKRASKTGGVRR